MTYIAFIAYFKALHVTVRYLFILCFKRARIVNMSLIYPYSVAAIVLHHVLSGMSIVLHHVYILIGISIVTHILNSTYYSFITVLKPFNH